MISPLGQGTLSLVGLFSLTAIAAAVLFIVYAAEWQHSDKYTGTAETEDAYEKRTRTEISYYAAVIVLLFVISGMHGFALVKELL